MDLQNLWVQIMGENLKINSFQIIYLKIIFIMNMDSLTNPFHKVFVKEYTKQLKQDFYSKNLNFNKSEALNETIKNYSNTLHNVTKASPNEGFYSSNNIYLRKTKQNIINYYINISSE